MIEDTEGDGDGQSDGDTTGLRADEGSVTVRPGDNVVHRTDLGKEYEYTVADVDATWITFETGQKVHRDRFEREGFSVVRTAPPSTPQVTVDGGAPDPEGATGGASAPATDGGDLRPPNPH